jgi:hypothetical protein
MSLPTQKNYH